MRSLSCPATKPMAEQVGGQRPLRGAQNECSTTYALCRLQSCTVHFKQVGAAGTEPTCSEERECT